MKKGISYFYVTSTLYLPFYLISVFLICACYILIVVKVRCSRHPYHHGRKEGIPGMYIDSTLYLSFYLISVFLIYACYILIVVKVRCSRHPYHHGAASLRERNLTGTSLIVALVSLLCYLPAITYLFARMLHYDLSVKLSRRSFFHIRTIVLIPFLANSIVNPVIYALRLPGFRARLSQLFCRASNRSIQPDLPLCNLRPA